MSFYTWLNGSTEGQGRYTPAAGQLYVAPDTAFYPPTFITYHLTSNQSEEEIKEYIKGLLNEKTEKYADQIIDVILAKIDNRLSSEIKNIIDETFKEIPLDNIDEYFQGGNN